MRVPTAVNLNIPVWILFLGSALVWYVSALSQYIPLLGQYWQGWQYRFEPWQWVAAVCAVWALVVLVLLHTVLGRRRWVRMLAERCTQGRAYLTLQQEGLAWQWTQMAWTKSRYLPGAELRCQQHQDSLAWRDVTTIFSVRSKEDSPKLPPPLVQVHSDVEDEQGQAVCLALPYERTRYGQEELLQLLQRTQSIALSFKPLPNSDN